MFMIRMLVLAAAAASLAVAADKKADPDPEPPAASAGKAAIRGQVTRVTTLKSKAYLGRLYIEGKKEKDTEHEKANVLVMSAAKVYFWKAGKKVEAKFDDIKMGSRVQCNFTALGKGGVVSTGRTEEVIILESPKK